MSNDKTLPRGTGTLDISLTSSAACGYDHVNLSITGVRINPNAQADDNDPSWQDVPLTQPQQVDLQSLSDGETAQLGTLLVPAGEYQQVQLRLGADDTATLPGGKVEAIQLGAAAQNGIRIAQPFSVLPRQRTGIAVDIALCPSLVPQSGGSVALQPVVRLAPLAQSGEISGYAGIALAGAIVQAQRNGAVLKQTHAGKDGHFVLSPLLQSASQGTYDVVILKPGYVAGIVRAVPVQSGGNTKISAPASPLILPADTATRIIQGTATPATAAAHVTAVQLSNGAAFQIADAYTRPGTGTYRLRVPVNPPRIGIYSGNLSIAWLADTGGFSHYSVSALSPASGVQRSVPDVSVASGNVTLPFTF